MVVVKCDDGKIFFSVDNNIHLKVKIITVLWRKLWVTDWLRSISTLFFLITFQNRNTTTDFSNSVWQRTIGQNFSEISFISIGRFQECCIEESVRNTNCLSGGNGWKKWSAEYLIEDLKVALWEVESWSQRLIFWKKWKH